MQRSIGGLRHSTSHATFSAKLQGKRRDARQERGDDVPAFWLERVTYHNSENGFWVLRAKVRGHRDVVTVVGHAAAIAAGEWITASGEWVNDRTHGQQFKAGFLRTSPPTSADGIEKYLSSGIIRGVGPVYAKKLMRALASFGRSWTAQNRIKLTGLYGCGVSLRSIMRQTGRAQLPLLAPMPCETVSTGHYFRALLGAHQGNGHGSGKPSIGSFLEDFNAPASLASI
jgi:hypothetical protein